MRFFALLALASGAFAAAIPGTEGMPEKCGTMYTRLLVKGDEGVPMYSTGRCDTLVEPIMTVVNEECGLCVFYPEPNCEGKKTYDGPHLGKKVLMTIAPSISYRCAFVF